MYVIQVLRAALWIFGEYSDSADRIKETLKQLRSGLGDMPMAATEMAEIAKLEEVKDGDDEPKLVYVFHGDPFTCAN